MLRLSVFGIFMLLLAACSIRHNSPQADPVHDANPAGSTRADLEDLGVAPELNNQVWLNTDVPLRLADLRGKVVVLDMWTFG